MSVTWTEWASAQLQAITDHVTRSNPGYAQVLGVMHSSRRLPRTPPG